MTRVIREWLKKAEGDFRTARRELEATEEPNYDAVVYHTKQCIGKYLKAILIKSGIRPPRIHDLVKLGKLLQEKELKLDLPKDDLEWLSKGGADFRYPFDSSDLEEARASFANCQKLRAELLKAFYPRIITHFEHYPNSNARHNRTTTPWRRLRRSEVALRTIISRHCPGAL